MSFKIAQYNYKVIMEEKPAIQKLPSVFNPTDVFRLELTPQEAAALTSLLPKNYSIQVDPRRKDAKPQVKKKTADELLLNSASQMLPKPKVAQSTFAPQTIPPKKGQKAQTMSQAVKPCLKTLQLLQQHKCGWPFLVPVDVDGLNIPEYRKIVKQPMDLSTVESKLKSGKYQTPTQFHSDVIKIFHNSYLFNQINQDFIKLTQEFQKYYYRISGESKPIPEKIAMKQPLLPSKNQKKKKKVPVGGRQLSESQPMTVEEKKQLAGNIHRLAKEHLKGVRSIVFQNNGEGSEFDLEQLSQKKLRELQKYVRNKINQMQNNLRFNLIQKTEQQNLDEFESEITEQFIDESLVQ